MSWKLRKKGYKFGIGTDGKRYRAICKCDWDGNNYPIGGAETYASSITKKGQYCFFFEGPLAARTCPKCGRYNRYYPKGR